MENDKSKNCPFLDEKPTSDIEVNSPQDLIARQIIELITACGCLKNRSIFLNGAWGSDKTSIIKYLEKEKTNFGALTIDAWDAPKTLITWDILKRIADRVLSIQHPKKRLENEKFQRWFASSHKKTLKNANITALVYLILFAFAPVVAFFITLYSEKAKESDSLIMFWVQPAILVPPSAVMMFLVICMAFFIFILSFKKSSEILLPFFSGSVSQYSEYSEGEDCPPSKAKEIAYHILEYYDKKPNLAVFIDNLDRLESSAQRNYLDALFIVMDAFFKPDKCQKCKAWFIIVSDESKMLGSANRGISNPGLWQNYADKIAPLRLFLPNPTQEALGLVFRKLWNETTDLNSHNPSVLDYILTIGTYNNYRDVKKTLNSILLLYSMLKNILSKVLDKDMALLAVCFVSVKSRELNFKFDKEIISRKLTNLPGFVNDTELLTEYIYSAYYLVPLLSQIYVFKLINDALKNSKALASLFVLAKAFPEKVCDFFVSCLSEACETPEGKRRFYLSIVYPINNAGGNP